MRKKTQISFAIFLTVFLSTFPFFRNVLPPIFSFLFFLVLLGWSLWVVYVTYLFVVTWKNSADIQILTFVRNLYATSLVPIFAWASALGVRSASSVAFNRISFPEVAGGILIIFILALMGFLLAFIPPLLLLLYTKAENEKIKRVLFWGGILYAGAMVLPYIFFAFLGLSILS